MPKRCKRTGRFLKGGRRRRMRGGRDDDPPAYDDAYIPKPPPAYREPPAYRDDRGAPPAYQHPPAYRDDRAPPPSYGRYSGLKGVWNRLRDSKAISTGLTRRGWTKTGRLAGVLGFGRKRR